MLCKSMRTVDKVFSMDEVKKLLKVQIRLSKICLDKRCPDLPGFIYNAMDLPARGADTEECECVLC